MGIDAFTPLQFVLIAAIFSWTGFVRTALGFGGAVLGLPLLLILGGTPIYWLPIISIHFLFFSTLTLIKPGAFKNTDWRFLSKVIIWIFPAFFLGLAGLLNLSDKIIAALVYCTTLVYAIGWIFRIKIASTKPVMDRFLLVIGSYVAGTSLTGAPPIVAVFTRYLEKVKLRNTLFVLWFVFVSVKMSTFVMFDVFIDFKFSVILMPMAAIGHVIGVKIHERLLSNSNNFQQWIGGALLVVIVIGLSKL